MGAVPDDETDVSRATSPVAREAMVVIDIDSDLSWRSQWADADALATLTIADSSTGEAGFEGWLDEAEVTALRRSLTSRRTFTARLPMRWNETRWRDTSATFTPLEYVSRAGGGQSDESAATGDAALGRWLVRLSGTPVAESSLSGNRSEAGLGLSLVAEVSGVLSDASSPRVIEAIAQLLTRRLGGWATFVVDGPELRTTDTVAAPPHRRDLKRLAAQSTHDDPVLDLFLSTSMRSIRLDSATEAEPETLTAELLELLREQNAPDPASQWVFPVLGRQRVLGLLVFAPLSSPETPAVDDSELATILELVARRIGMAMDNAELYAREHRLAETLQRAMLPEQAEITDLDVWTYYAPSASHAQVGGDWYDVLDQGEGRVGLVVGDVVGHDVEAAAAMGQMRSVVRAYAAEFSEPGTVLDRVDKLVKGIRTPRPASLVYVTMAPLEDGEWELSYGRAGHLPPILVHDGRARILDEAGGSLIGFGVTPRGTATVRAWPGDVLVCYTDGLIERRRRPMREGMQALADLCGSLDLRDAAGVGEEVLGTLADDPEDDIALVVVRIPDLTAAHSSAVSGPRQRRWQLPAEPQTTARARHALLRTCRAWQIADTSAAELVISELVSNAVMHGRGRVDLRIQDTGDGLRIEVEDGNPAPPVMRESSRGASGGFGLHIIDHLADWGWRPSGTGKIVWARLRRDSGLPSPGGPSAPSVTVH